MKHFLHVLYWIFSSSVYINLKPLWIFVFLYNYDRTPFFGLASGPEISSPGLQLCKVKGVKDCMKVLMKIMVLVLGALLSRQRIDGGFLWFITPIIVFCFLLRHGLTNPCWVRIERSLSFISFFFGMKSFFIKALLSINYQKNK